MKKRKSMLLIVILLSVLVLTGCDAKSNQSLGDINKITFVRTAGGINEIEMFVITPDFIVKQYVITPYSNSQFDLFAGQLPSEEEYMVNEWQISETSWNNIVDALRTNDFMNLPEEIPSSDQIFDAPSYYIAVETADIIHRTGGYNAGQAEDSDNKRFKSSMDTLLLEIANKIENPENKEISDSQLYSFIIPKSILDLGSRTVEDYVAEYNEDAATALGPLGEEIPIKQAYAGIYENDDGTMTFVFTAKQLEWYKQSMRNAASLCDVIQSDTNTADKSPVKRTEFTSDDLTETIVYVDGYDYYDISDAIATAMGLYQIASGVDPNEWTAHVVVKNYETGEVISENDYPAER